MAKEDLVRIEGTVTDLSGAGQYTVKLDNGATLSARLSGKLKKFRIRVLVGDRVTVGISPYDPTHGLIVQRQRLPARKTA